MKLVLLGAEGQVGWELRRALAPLGQLLALSRGMEGGDLSRMIDMARTIRQFHPDVIVNAAAYTAVDLAESQSKIAHAVNGRAPGELAEIASELGAWLVHYSTDYVFDGSGRTPWRETDATRALNVYGASKLEGEEAIRESGCRNLIFRTSWVFSRRGNNFVRTILRLAAERDFLCIVDDQIGAPTGAALLADASAHAIRTAASRPSVAGLYNLAASGETSWFDYARFVVAIAEKQSAQFKLRSRAISPVATAEYPSPAQRPLNSRLDTHRFTETFDLCLPPWESGVVNTLNEILDARSC